MDEVKADEKPEVKTDEKSEVKTDEKPDSANAPVFKVQILTSNVKLSPKSKRLKGREDADFYKDGGIYKYTLGSSTNYNEIYRLRKQVLDKFPEAFIIAFRNGQRMDVQEAVREFRRLRIKG